MKKSESELVKGCIRNDRSSQELLYRAYFNPMARMCRRYTEDQDTIMQIVNDGFLKVFKKIDTFKNTGSLEGWIRRIVFHALSDHFRKKDSKIKFVEIFANDSVEKEFVTSKIGYDDLMKIIYELPTMGRRVFILFAIEGYSHNEIGQQLNISDGTSKWHLSKAREVLKKKLKEEYKVANYA